MESIADVYETVGEGIIYFKEFVIVLYYAVRCHSPLNMRNLLSKIVRLLNKIVRLLNKIVLDTPYSIEWKF